MKTTSTVRVTEHEGRKFSATYTAAGMVAHEVLPRVGRAGFVDMILLTPDDPAVPLLLAENEPPIDPNAARYREALEHLSKADGSGFSMFGSASATMMAQSVRAYCVDVLNGAKAGT